VSVDEPGRGHDTGGVNMKLLPVEEALGTPNVECPECLGLGWTCEVHLGQPWSYVVGDERGCKPDCGGPGVPCRCRPGARRERSAT
jgi:hypothetical protein